MVSRKTKVIGLSIGQGFDTIVGMVSGMVFARLLPYETMATYKQTIMAYEFAVPFLTIGIPNSMYYFLSGATKRQRGIILDNLALLLVMGSLFSFFLLCGGTSLLMKRFSNPELEKTLSLFIIYPLVTFPLLSLNAVLIIYERINLSVCYTLGTKIMMTLTLIAVCVFTKDARMLVLTRVVYAVFCMPVLLFIVFHVVKSGFDFPRLKKMFEVLKFSIPLGISSSFGSVCRQLGGIIVASTCLPEAYSIFSVGSFEVPIIGVFTTSVNTIILADMIKECKNGRKETAHSLFRLASEQSALFIFPCFLFLLLNSKDIIITLFSDKYLASTPIFAVFQLVMPFRIVVFGTAFMALGKTKMIMYRTIIQLIFELVTCIYFTNVFGPVGAAIAWALTAYFCEMPYNFYFLSKEFNCSIFQFLNLKKLSKYFLVSLISGMTCLPLLLFSNIPSLLRLIINFAAFSITYTFLAWLFIPEWKTVLLFFLSKVDFMHHFHTESF